MSAEVTPHVGVWIETPLPLLHHRQQSVTPHVGVWIETINIEKQAGRLESHLM